MERSVTHQINNAIKGMLEKAKNSMTKLPKMYRLRQHFARPTEDDVPAAVRRELAALNLNKTVSPGQKIGITVGSRGIRNLVPVLKICVDHVRELGAEPVLVSAMGSHGGGTEQGQREILDSLDITEKNLGAPVVTCAKSPVVAKTAGGLPVYCLESALALDGILAVNRIKIHTAFKGAVESGLVKMLVVGLGGPAGAKQFHGFGPLELPRLLPEIGQVLLDALPVLGGLAIVENAHEETALIRAVTKDRMIEQESELLTYSRSLMPSLPVDAIDFLIIREMGKNFSGTGMDSNIIGRSRIPGVPEPEKPAIKRIAVLDLSEKSHGNANGIGMADFTTRKLVEKMDRQATYLNCLTTTFVGRGAIPLYFDTEEQLVDAALSTLSDIPTDKLRMVIVPNTLHLHECLVSEAIAAEARGKPGREVEDGALEIGFENGQHLLLPVQHQVG